MYYETFPQHKEQTMKQNRFKTLWGMMLGLALLAVAPFTASAQVAASAVPRPDDPAPDDPENAVVSITARFNG